MITQTMCDTRRNKEDMSYYKIIVAVKIYENILNNKLSLRNNV